MNIPLIIQIQKSDNGGAALAMMLGYYKRYVTIAEMRRVCISSRNGSDADQICDAARHYGLEAKTESVTFEELCGMKLPILVTWKKKYYCVVEKITRKKVVVLDPAKGRYSITLEKFKSSYSKRAILLKPGKDFVPGGSRPTAISFLHRRLEGYRGWFVFISCLSAALVLSNILYLNYKQEMVDTVMSGDRGGDFTSLSVILVATMLLQFIINITNQVITSKVSRSMSANSAAKIYKSLFRLPLSYFEKISRGEIMERLDSNTSIDKSILTTLTPKFFNAVALVFYVGLIYSYDPLLAVVLTAVYLLVSIALVSVQKYSVMINRSIVSANESMRSSLFNALNSIDGIKASGREDKFFSLWNEQVRELKDENTKSLTLDSAISFLQALQNLLSSAIMLIMGAYLIINGHLTIGMYACVQTVFTHISSTMQGLFSTTKQIQTMRTGLERISDISNYDTIPEIPLNEGEIPDKLPGEVNCEHVYFRYNEGDEYVLSDINLTIAPGEMVALVGASGCGKSTLMKLLAGMYQVQEGSISYSGKKREEISDVVFHSSVGCVDQEVNMFADSIRANLKMWDDTVEDFEMILAARDAQIHNRIIKNSYGYDSMVKDSGRNYSGGEQQRLELARTLSAEPTLMILDEFTSALDAVTEKKVFDAIRDKRVSCLIAAHRLSTVVECDRIYVMEHGRIVEQGTHEKLYEKKGLYYKLLCLQ